MTSLVFILAGNIALIILLVAVISGLLLEGVSSHLSEYAELPLSFHFPDGGVKHNRFIALTEGVGFKPQLTANHFGLLSLGASGGLFAVSPKLLKVYLNKASNILHTKSVLLFPDAGAVKNPLVLRQYKRTIDLISSSRFLCCDRV